MKKTMMLFMVAFATFTILEAQYFAGGSLSFSTSGGSVENGSTTIDDETRTSFGLNPRGGMVLNEDLWVGLSLSFNTSKVDDNDDPATISTQSSFGLAPFVRYYAFRFGDFSIYGQGQVGFNTGSSKVEAGNTTTDGPRTNTIFISAMPGLAYNLSENIILETGINLASIAFSSSTTTTEIEGSDDIKSKDSSFSLGAGTNNIVNLGSITIGAVFLF